MASNLVLEPQAQLIWQHVDFDTARDLFSTFDPDNALTGRIGLRLRGTYTVGSTVLEPYLKANVWHTFEGSDPSRAATRPALRR